jgi:hypothetical protein
MLGQVLTVSVLASGIIYGKDLKCAGGTRRWYAAAGTNRPAPPGTCRE